MRQSGLADLVAGRDGLRRSERRERGDGPQRREGLRRLDSPTGGESALGVVDFSIFPHLDHEELPDHSMAGAETWAAGLRGSGCAIDDETAIKVTDGTVDVVSEGHWKLFTP